MALAVLVLPMNWMAAVFLAGCFHELCHYLVLRLCGVRVFGVTLDIGGAKMDTAPMEEREMLLCALAGPLGSFLLVLMLGYFPRLALCGLAQGLYNLLPIYPLDGGRILRNCLQIFCPGRAKSIEKGTCLLTAMVLLLLGLWGFLRYELGLGVLTAALFPFLRLLAIKRPCKEGRKRVQ